MNTEPRRGVVPAWAAAEFDRLRSERDSARAMLLEALEAGETLKAQRDDARSERDRARDLCVRLEFALHDLGAWNPGEPGRPDKVGQEMISWDIDRRGVASIERPR